MRYDKVTFTFAPSTLDSALLQTSRDLLTGMAGEVGFDSFEDTDTGIVGYVQSDLASQEVLDALVSDFMIPGVSISYEREQMEDKDWNAVWEDEGYSPIMVGERCVIHDTKHPVSVPSDCLDILIDAKMAFGTGTHETTRMVVAELLGSAVSGKRVLDCGCGTGILSIVSSKLGASEVVSYDIDEWSVENTRHNAELNGVTNIDVFGGDSNVLSHVSGVFDVVVANINRNVLLSDMPSFREVMASGARLILSGFYEEDAPSLIAKGTELGLTLLSTRHEGDWASLTLES